MEDKSGRVREVLPVFMVGETGAAKSALVRNFSAITGTQLFTLPCFARMEIDALFGGIELSQDRQTGISLCLERILCPFRED